MNSTRLSRHVRAPRETVYRALIDAEAIARWRTPDGMRCEVHEFDGREGGRYRVTLTPEVSAPSGGAGAGSRSCHGRFVRLVPDEQVVEVVEFDSLDPALAGEMVITTTLESAAGGTRVVAVHEGLPAGLSPADNEAGWRESLARLAALAEAAA